MYDNKVNKNYIINAEMDNEQFINTTDMQGTLYQLVAGRTYLSLQQYVTLNLQILSLGIKIQINISS